MSKLVTIYGGSGFVGRYVARRLAKEGWRIRVAVRRPEGAMFVRPYGVPGQVEPVLCNIRDDASVRAAMQGADAVVNCVGIMASKGRNSFDAVQGEGAGRIAKIAAEMGVQHLVHISAIGADAQSDSLYAQSKAAGEAAVLAAFPSAVILRPSVIFGPEDKFFNRFASMALLAPVLPLIGAESKFQPVYVDDVARAAVLGVNGQAAPGIYELGGPEAESFRTIIGKMLEVIHRRRLVLNLPFFVGGLIGATAGRFTSKVASSDQVRLLRQDNVVSPGAKGLSDLGIEATSYEAVIGEYLWRFRPSGQYAAIKESAKNLKKA